VCVRDRRVSKSLRNTYDTRKQCVKTCEANIRRLPHSLPHRNVFGKLFDISLFQKKHIILSYKRLPHRNMFGKLKD